MSRLGAWALAAAVVHGACDEAARSRPPADSGTEADASGSGGSSGSGGGITLGGADAGPSPPPSFECTAAPEPNDGGTSPPIPAGVVADFAETGSRPRVVIAPNGDAVLAWSSAGIVHVRVHREGTWSPVETVNAPLPLGLFVSGLSASPWVALGTDGRALVAYEDRTASSFALVCARERSASGTWSAPMLVGATGMGWWQEPTAPAVALGYDAAGNGFTLLRALSILGANVPTGLLARRMAPGAGFGAAEVLDSEPPGELSLAVQGNGYASAVWSNAMHHAATSSFSPAGGWKGKSVLHASAHQLSVVAEPDGHTSALGALWNGSGSDIFVQRAGLDGQWGAPAKLAEVTSPYHTFLVGDGAGRLLAAWSTWPKGCAPESAVSMRDASLDWQVASTIPGLPLGKAFISGVALAPTGHAAVVWHDTEVLSTNSCKWLAPRVSWLVPGAGWQPSTVLDADPSSGEVSLAMTPNGRVLVAWQHGGVVLVRWIDPP